MTLRTWTIIICAATIMAIALGLRQGLGLYLPPMSKELGVSRETFALGLGLMNLMWGMLSPFTGGIADRYGAGLVAAISGVLYAAGLMIMTMSGQGGQLIWAGIFIGLGLSGTGFSVILGTVARAVTPEKRGMALGIASMGGSFGQFAALPYTHLAIDSFGWAQSLILLAATAMIMTALAAGIAGKPQTAKQSAGAPSTVPSLFPSSQTMMEAFYEANADRSFWLLIIGFFVCGFHVAFIATHLPAFLADLHFEPWVGVTALALVGLFNIIGSFVCGIVADRYSKKIALNVLYFSRAVVFLIFFLLPISTVSVLVFASVMGLLWLGTVPLTSGLIAQIYGTQYMSMLFGIVFFSHQVGAFLGAWVAGRIYDMLGTYDPIWWTSIALGVLAGMIHWPIKEEPNARMKAAEQQAFVS